MKREKYTHLIEVSPSVTSQDNIQFIDVDERYSFEAIADGQVIAFVIHDDQHNRHRGCWAVVVDGVELHRSINWAECCDYVRVSYRDGTLPKSEASVVEQPQNALALEALLDKPFDELTSDEWRSLKKVKLVL